MTQSFPHHPPLPRAELLDLIQMALSGWFPAPVAGIEALMDRVEAGR